YKSPISTMLRRQHSTLAEQITQIDRHLRLLALPEVPEIPNAHVAVRELGNDFQLAAHRLDEAAQRADVHVGALLQLCDRRLLDMKDLAECGLRQRPGLAELREVHVRAQFFGDPLDANLAS